MRDITVIWERIKEHQGEQFETTTHLPFTYAVNKNSLVTTRSHQVITVTDFEKILPLAPVSGPGKINELVRGPAYVWAIVHDPRIRLNDW